jgi:hypothetical protein
MTVPGQTRRFGSPTSLPVYPQHQTFPAPAGTSQKGQFRTLLHHLT